jgi:hypothetical protein
MAVGGDVFVLDMGELVRIVDLARRMIELSGRSIRDEGNPGGDITIEVTGLRPGMRYAVRVTCKPVVLDPLVVIHLSPPSEVTVVCTPATPPSRKPTRLFTLGGQMLW